MLDTLPEIAWAIWLAVGCFVAVWRGCRLERVCAGLLVVAWTASQLLLHERWTEVQSGVAVVDMLLLLALLVPALRSDRFWPMFAAAFQLLTCAGHLSQALDATLSSWSYLTSNVVWSYLVVLALIVGCIMEGGARSRDGSKPALRRLRRWPGSEFAAALPPEPAPKRHSA